MRSLSFSSIGRSKYANETLRISSMRLSATPSPRNNQKAERGAGILDRARCRYLHLRRAIQEGSDIDDRNDVHLLELPRADLIPPRRHPVGVNSRVKLQIRH